MLKLAIFGLLLASLYSYVIQVAGLGQVTVKPDTATISISISVTGTTTQLAQNELDNIINSVVTALAAQGVPSSDIQTSYFQFYPQYNYSNSPATIIGYQAYESMTVTVRSLTANGVKLAKVIDALVLINGIQLSGVSFSLANTATASKSARANAWADALAKAQQYAQLSGLTLGKAQQIVDNPTPINSYTPNIFYEPQIPSISPTTILTGVIQVIDTLLVHFHAY